MAETFDHLAADSPDAPRAIRPWVFNPLTGQVDLDRQPQPGEADPDYFALLGLPRRILLDVDAIEVAHRSLIRGLHPDRFHAQGPQAVAKAQWHSSRVNDAWRGLKTLDQRAAYVLTLAGENVDERYRPPASLLAQVMEANEAIDDAGRDPAARVQLLELLADFQLQRKAMTDAIANAAAAWDAAEASADATAAGLARAGLRAALGQARYVDNLIGRATAALAAPDAAYPTN
jgi:molecular chaperone HscB